MKSSRVEFLDQLRAISLLLIVFHHFGIRHHAGAIARFISERAYVGVDFFFVLSGWLIGGQLFRRMRQSGEPGRKDIVHFWARRWLQTLPNYSVVLFLLLLLGQIPKRHAPVHLLFLQNYLSPRDWIASWSLCVEEYFYLLLPVVIWVLAKTNSSLRSILVASVFAFSVACRLAFFVRHDNPDLWLVLDKVVFRTHMRLDGLAFGVALAAAHEWETPLWRFLQRHRYGFAVVGASLILLHWNPFFRSAPEVWSYRCRFYYVVADFLVTSAGVTLLFPLGIATRTPAAPLVTVTSEHVYAAYLLHPLIIDWTDRAGFVTGMFWLDFAIAVVATAACSFVLRALVENPCLRLRDRLLGSAWGSAGYPPVPKGLPSD